MLSYNIYPYVPSKVLPIVFAVLIGISLVIHFIQNIRYRAWRVTFWLSWGGAVFLTGWISRAISVHDLENLNLYIVQSVFVLAGPPIYAAAEYNILGRLMHYLPMHAPLNPGRVIIFFIYTGTAVESLTATGASRLAAAKPGSALFHSGGVLISISLVLQGAVELVFMGSVALVHRRCVRAKMLPKNVRVVFIMLYGTSTLILLRCIFRAVQSFASTSGGCSTSYAECGSVTTSEWYLFVFEAAPMVVYTYWLNFVHPGLYLPMEKKRYLDLDGKTERMGPGWIDNRNKWVTFADLFDVRSIWKGKSEESMFWLRPQEWPACETSFALGTGTNVKGKRANNAMGGHGIAVGSKETEEALP
ncbi:hypothetical protein MMC25_003230 [Agyrium rufum]|nr:hypothetical protein [Agyrium rufum]